MDDGPSAPMHPISRPGFCGPRLPIPMGSLRSSAPDHDLGHLATECLAPIGNHSSRPGGTSSGNHAFVRMRCSWGIAGSGKCAVAGMRVALEAPAMTLPSALEGVRVLDLATIYAGPFAAMLLGDFGADVIKIEHPRGDPMRGHGHARDGVGLWWKVVSRNKRAVTLDLGKPAGQDLLRSLVEQSDVLIENFRPGVMERWNLGYEDLRAVNPRLVMLRATGFGQFGPYANRPGFGTLAESMSGFAHLTGQPDGPPTLPPFGLADGIAGLAGAVAVMTALYHRDARGGEGQMIDLAIIEPILLVLGAQPTIYDQLGLILQRMGNRSGNNAPRNTYRTRDGRWVAVSTSADSIAG